MVHLITPPHYQLPELVLLTGGIAAVWFGGYWDNRQSPWTLPESPGVESASTDLILGVPLTGRHGQRRPL